jgi:hypothetical protein
MINVAQHNSTTTRQHSTSTRDEVPTVTDERFPRLTTVRLKPEYAGKWNRTVFTVDRYLQVNLQVITPQGKKLRGKPYMFERASDVPVTTGHGNSNTGVQVTLEPLPPSYPDLPVGTFVTVAGPRWKNPAGQVYVVLQDRGDKVKLALAGGDSGRYYTNIPRSYVAPVAARVVLEVKVKP